MSLINLAKNLSNSKSTVLWRKKKTRPVQLLNTNHNLNIPICCEYNSTLIYQKLEKYVISIKRSRSSQNCIITAKHQTKDKLIHHIWSYFHLASFIPESYPEPNSTRICSPIICTLRSKTYSIMILKRKLFGLLTWNKLCAGSMHYNFIQWKMSPTYSSAWRNWNTQGLWPLFNHSFRHSENTILLTFSASLNETLIPRHCSSGQMTIASKPTKKSGVSLA